MDEPAAGVARGPRGSASSSTDWTSERPSTQSSTASKHAAAYPRLRYAARVTTLKIVATSACRRRRRRRRGRAGLGHRGEHGHPDRGRRQRMIRTSGSQVELQRTSGCSCLDCAGVAWSTPIASNMRRAARAGTSAAVATRGTPSVSSAERRLAVTGAPTRRCAPTVARSGGRWRQAPRGAGAWSLPPGSAGIERGAISARSRSERPSGARAGGPHEECPSRAADGFGGRCAALAHLCRWTGSRRARLRARPRSRAVGAHAAWCWARRPGRIHKERS